MMTSRRVFLKQFGTALGVGTGLVFGAGALSKAMAQPSIDNIAKELENALNDHKPLNEAELQRKISKYMSSKFNTCEGIIDYDWDVQRTGDETIKYFESIGDIVGKNYLYLNEELKAWFDFAEKNGYKGVAIELFENKATEIGKKNWKKYRGTEFDATNYLNLNKRATIGFKEIAEMYDDVLCLALNTYTVNPDEIISTFHVKNSKSNLDYGANQRPSIVLASQFDLLKGETMDNNNGKFKIIDIKAGGADDNKYIYPNVNNDAFLWINPNVFMVDNPKNDGRFGRYNNKYNISVAGKNSNFKDY